MLSAMALRLRRTLFAVTDEDRPGGGRPWMFGFGPGYLSWLGRVKRNSIRAIIRIRKIPLHDPVLAIAWGLARRNHRETATAVLKAFGYDRLYRVRSRSIGRNPAAAAKVEPAVVPEIIPSIIGVIGPGEIADPEAYAQALARGHIVPIEL